MTKANKNMNTSPAPPPEISAWPPNSTAILDCSPAVSPKVAATM